jgi:beta-lactamase regulating signal transducer with metallopeptidase domain
MWFDSSLAGLSLGITYFLQVALAYLMTLCICAFIQSPRSRVRIWGGFLFLTIAAWLLLWVPAPAGGPLHFAFRSASLPSVSDLRVALPVKGTWVSHITQLAPRAWRLYVLLVIASLLHLLLESIQLKALLRRTEPPSPQLQLLFQRLCLQLRINRCELSLVSELRSPATCYWLRSHVLLPTELVPQLDRDQLADVLRHELIHVRQHDYLWDRLAALGCRLVLFHPLVWLGYRCLRRERELACDYAAVEKHADARLRYAECLTRLARWFIARGNLSEGIGFSSSESLLATRVRALLREPSPLSAYQKAARGGLATIMATVAFLLVPSLGLTLYSPGPLASVLTRSGNTRSHSARRKTPGGKLAHSSVSQASTAEPLWIMPQPKVPRVVDLLSDFPSAPLPVLRDSSTAATSMAETSSTSLGEIHDGTALHSSHPAWDEASMPLASPPNWRKLVISAIAGGVGIATGRIDVDDADEPRKRSH